MKTTTADLAIMKRRGIPGVYLQRPESIAKADVQTFSERQASGEIAEWLTPALDTLAQVVRAAMYPPAPAEGETGATPEQRLDAVRVSIDQFSEQLLGKVAEAIVKRASGPVRKGDDDGWSGFFR